MANPKNRQEARLQALINTAREKNIEVRTEKLLREVGYRAHSGRYRINGREVILIDRDAPLSDQIDFLSSVLAEASEAAAPILLKLGNLSGHHSGQSAAKPPPSG